MSRLSLVIRTWHEEQNFGIFDFHNQENTTQNTFILDEEEAFLCRYEKSQDLVAIPKSNIKNHLDRAVIKIKRTQHGFMLKPVNVKESASNLYKVIAQNDGLPGYSLCQGDQFKLGQVTFKILRLSHIKEPISSNQTVFNPQHSGVPCEITAKIYKEIDTVLISEASGMVQTLPACRYCFSHKSTPGNKLVDCCGCKGQTNYVHRNCVKQWIKNKLKMGEFNDVLWFERSAITCQLCLQIFDIRLILQLTYSKKLSNFAMVEHSEEPSMIYVFTMFQTGKVVVGRSKKADLSIRNETVSKRHCLISLNYKTNIFSLYDLNSKFGTLLKIKNTIRKNTVIQYDRYVIDAQMLPPRKNIFQLLSTLCNPYDAVHEEWRQQSRSKRKQLKQNDD